MSAPLFSTASSPLSVPPVPITVMPWALAICDRRDADAAAGAMHEHGFAWLGVGAMKERAVGRGIRHADRRALRKR